MNSGPKVRRTLRVSTGLKRTEHAVKGSCKPESASLVVTTTGQEPTWPPLAIALELAVLKRTPTGSARQAASPPGALALALHVPLAGQPGLGGFPTPRGSDVRVDLRSASLAVCPGRGPPGKPAANLQAGRRPKGSLSSAAAHWQEPPWRA